MTTEREKQMHKALNGWVKEYLPCVLENLNRTNTPHNKDQTSLCLEDGFEAGSKWADSNPFREVTQGDSCQKGDRPRILWLDDTKHRLDNGNAIIFEGYEEKPDTWDDEFDPEYNTQVIEHSAYVQLEEKLNVALLALETLSSVRSEQSEYLRIAVEALNDISDWDDIDDPSVTNEQTIARRALSKINEKSK